MRSVWGLYIAIYTQWVGLLLKSLATLVTCKIYVPSSNLCQPCTINNSHMTSTSLAQLLVGMVFVFGDLLGQQAR